MFLLHTLAQQLPTDSTDPTGVNTALYSIATLFASFIGGALALVLVVEGYQYLFSDAASRGMHLKRSLIIILGGTLLIVLGVAAAPTLVGFVHPK
jgi:hypothetical protein